MKRDQDTAVNSVCFKQNRRWKGRAATFTYNRQRWGKKSAARPTSSLHCACEEKKSLTLLSAPELPLDLGSDRGFQDVLKDQHLQPG
ncbi:hypothetical protein NDU88_004758 [Pleurodeles waltl]|uniref:Uncharacterized protein n=1 Tax=Pleurodeles waltl TaxID=8319 RepID=A0AAV7KZA8_PLEWA|nr:hypothetical protein NDU88_004758 [Pleurodeles waltl]